MDLKERLAECVWIEDRIIIGYSLGFLIMKKTLFSLSNIENRAMKCFQSLYTGTMPTEVFQTAGMFTTCYNQVHISSIYLHASWFGDDEPTLYEYIEQNQINPIVAGIKGAKGFFEMRTSGEEQKIEEAFQQALKDIEEITCQI